MSIKKIPMIPSRIEPTTFRFEAQCLNQLCPRMESGSAGKTCCLPESGDEIKHAGSWNVVKWKLLIHDMWWCREKR
jgi:hypothetical protein